MTTLLLALALLFGSTASPDLTGIWTGPGFYIVLKQDGNTISGTGGPDKSEQMPFTSGKVDGNHIEIKVGKFELDLRVNATGDAIDGLLHNGPDESMEVHVKRFNPDAPAPAPPTAFEAASIKPNNSGSKSSRSSVRAATVMITNMPLKAIIEQVYDLKDFSISGPDWLMDARFDIQARAPERASRDDMKIMMQKLLADRFKLAFHRETKTLPAYGLVVAKGGMKIKEAEPGPSSTNSGPGKLTGQKMTMARFADWLSTRMDRPVQDKTDVKGVFDINLEWTPGDESPTPPGEAPAVSANPAGPSIFTALQEQLGLRLQAQKLPVEILVVDHIERMPTEN